MINLAKYQERLDEKRRIVNNTGEDRLVLSVSYMGWCGKWKADVDSQRLRGYCTAHSIISSAFGITESDLEESISRIVEDAIKKIDRHWKYEPNTVVLVFDEK